jgi:hypothetical protein
MSNPPPPPPPALPPPRIRHQDEDLLERKIKIQHVFGLLAFIGTLLSAITGYQIIQIDKLRDRAETVGREVEGIKKDLGHLNEKVGDVKTETTKTRELLEKLERK